MKVPAKWSDAIIYIIFRKGDKNANCRPISLLSQTSCKSTKLIQTNLRGKLQKQVAYNRGFSIINHLQT